MCNPCSMVVAKGPKAYWSKVNESHTAIRKEHGMPENGLRPVNVQIEITPPNGNDFETPLDEWVFNVDQDQLPGWWNAEDAEKECRSELEEWAKVRLVRAGEKRDVKEGENVVAVCGGTVNEVRGGTVAFRFAFSCKLTGLFSVVISRIGKTAKCFVGTEKTRTITVKE